MKEPLVAISILLVITLGASIIVIDTADATGEANYYIQTVQDGNDIALSVANLNSGVSVTWDLGDGRVVRNPSVETSFKSGLWKIKAVIDNSAELERWIGIYDEEPSTNAERNKEYRYGVFATNPDLKVRDSRHEEVFWLKYDAENRVLMGVPDVADLYSVWFNGEFWKIYVTDKGAKITQQTTFNVEADGNYIMASPNSQHDVSSRYSWSVRSMDGTLVGYHEGRNLDLGVLNGYYTVHLQHIGVFGVSNYAKMVFVEGETIGDDEEIPTESKSFTIPTILIILTIILMIIALIRPIYAVYSAISGLIAIFSVII